MKRHSYAKIIGMSWHWMATMLFKPFSFKKWVMLGIIVILAGQLGGYFNFNLQRGDDKLERLLKDVGKKAGLVNRQPRMPDTYFGLSGTGEKKSPDQPTMKQRALDFKKKYGGFIHKRWKTVLAIALIAPYILFVIFLIILWIWVRAGFSFVFMESVVKNDASFAIPFHKFRPQADSYFKWSLAYGAATLLVLGSIIFAPARQLIMGGVFSKTPIDIALILSTALLYAPILILFALIFSLITVLVWDFVLPIMHKKKCSILQAMSSFAVLLKNNIGEILLYLLVKIGLAVAAIIASIVITVLGLIFIIVAGGLFLLAGGLISNLLPAVFRIILFLAAGLPVFAALGFLFTLFYLPIPLFFRIFPMCVLGSIDESLDLFAVKTSDELIREEDDEKYSKSMRAVWFAVLSPGIALLLGAALAVSIPRLLDIKIKMPQIFSSCGENGVSAIKDPPAAPDFSKKGPGLKGKIVIVHLVNGSIFEAVIANESEDNVAFNIEGGTVVYPRKEILKIEKKEGR